MPDLVVRRRDIERDDPPAGAFRGVAYARGLVPSFLTRSLGVFCVDTTERVYSLTYDDGPDPRSTPGVLDALARHGARATFFVLSEPARRHPGIVRRIVADGHELALHGRDHTSLLTMDDATAVATIRDARAAVEDVAGTPVRLYRPPYGEHTWGQARGVRRLGLDLTIWSGDAFDWVHDEEEAVARRALSSVFPGAILLLHDTRADPETLGPGERLPEFDRADVLDRVLSATRARGFTEATTGDLTARHRRVRSMARERMGRR
ncbi:polysaccharide deacetylase family protein [Cellulosimicrobium cellulans]|uniref:polysaccharide deacetylase family protein n=1 Tax=Cellulosimicrobium cellulans TaxID=1710 RepID=UPI001EDA248E|nr:polysaccharide deacetylase family protein [Cellulosimicrobium cellulans]UKJ62245.1 polysaccharide deacetylase family protein [Cellulosimicrobium cellulans]